MIIDLLYKGKITAGTLEKNFKEYSFLFIVQKSNNYVVSSNMVVDYIKTTYLLGVYHDSSCAWIKINNNNNKDFTIEQIIGFSSQDDLEIYGVK